MTRYPFSSGLFVLTQKNAFLSHIAVGNTNYFILLPLKNNKKKNWPSKTKLNEISVFSNTLTRLFIYDGQDTHLTE